MENVINTEANGTFSR